MTHKVRVDVYSGIAFRNGSEWEVKYGSTAYGVHYVTTMAGWDRIRRSYLHNEWTPDSTGIPRPVAWRYSEHNLTVIYSDRLGYFVLSVSVVGRLPGMSHPMPGRVTRWHSVRVEGLPRTFPYSNDVPAEVSA